MRLVFLSFCLSSLFIGLGHSQSLNHKQGEIIVRLNNDVDVDEFLQKVNYLRASHHQVHFKAKVSDYLNIWLLKVDHNTVNELTFLSKLKSHPLVQNVQLNHRITARENIPNDEKLIDQWYIYNTGQNSGLVGADVNMINAWDISTGGDQCDR